MTMAVPATAEFHRIANLPTRPHDWDKDRLEHVTDQVTEMFRAPGGTARLRPIQARALVELAQVGYFVGEIGAGNGKALLSFLTFTALGAKRGLLLVPAHLKEQTITEWTKWAKHFRLLPFDERPGVKLVSYSALSTVRFANLLEEYHPDVIVCDEAQALARQSSARTRRVFRYLKKCRKAGERIVFVPMSGTMRRKSLRECAHLYEAAADDQSPIPTEYPDLVNWRLAIDEGVSDQDRIAPGALARLATPDELSRGLEGIRHAVRRRILSTPGIIATSDQCVDVPLIIRPRIVSVPEKVSKAFADLRSMGVLPSGDTFDAGVSAWNHARELACGFTYRWDPPAPPEWMEARRQWNAFVRNAIEDSGHSGNPLDSPLQVWRAVERGVYGPVPEWDAWKAVRDTFVPNPVPFWLDDWLVKDAEQWALDNNGIVWVGHAAAFTKGAEASSGEDDLGKAFTKIPYFGGGAAGDAIRTYKGPCAASIRSHGTGKNLVYWSKALIMTLPSSGATLEQLLARHQRLGQEADEVVFEFYLHTRELFTAWQSARSEAKFAEAMNGSPQRVLGATVIGLDEEKYEKMLVDKAAPPEWAAMVAREGDE